jgi:CRP/FNR family transcriptional regulator, cyclic AMP receptor protein
MSNLSPYLASCELSGGCAEVALLQLPAKLAKSMLRLLDLHRTPRKTPIIHYSQRDLANMVGGTRESVNRCLRNWQRNGIVQITEGSIIITNRPALEQMAEPT